LDKINTQEYLEAIPPQEDKGNNTLDEAVLASAPINSHVVKGL
jgi:hypothetical protein